MARNTTLVALLDMLRVAARISLNPAHNADDRPYQVKMLQMEQERLWEDFDWPHLRVQRQVAAEAGQRYYETPPDMRIDRIEKIEVFTDGDWCTVEPGIESAHYGLHNSDLDERHWPIRRWQPYENDDVELWPIADQNADATTREGYIRFTGIRNLSDLVADTDRADLDDQMIVNYVAATILAGKGAKEAGMKLNAANDRYARLRGRLTPRTKFKMFGIGEQTAPRRIQITNYRPAGS